MLRKLKVAGRVDIQVIECVIPSGSSINFLMVLV